MKRWSAGWLALLACTAGLAQSEQFALPDTVYQEKSLYRNILVVEGEGYRCMKFGRFHARQTCIRLGQPHQLVLRPHNATRPLPPAHLSPCKQ